MLMIKFIWSAVLLSFVLLLTVTIMLARLNWNDEVRGRVYSIVLGGTGALLLAILSALKPSSFQKAFVAPVPFNAAAGGPPLVVDSPNPRWGELAILAKPAISKAGQTVVTVTTPTTAPRPGDRARRIWSLGFRTKCSSRLRSGASHSPPVGPGHRLRRYSCRKR